MMKGFGGMNPGNMQNLMRQAQKMQAELQEQSEKAEQELQNATLTASSGGGMVTVEVSGLKKVKSIKINPQAVDPDDVEMLEDLVLSATNEALAKAQELEEKLKPNVPGGLF